MAKRWSALVLLTASMTCIGFAVYVLAVTRAVHAAPARSGQLTDDLIPQPTTWVPFTADVVVTHADGREAVYGRFYRNRAGSTRLDTGRKGEILLTFIQNVAKSEHYTWSSRKNLWTVGPMKLPPQGWHPSARRMTVAGLRKHPSFVELRRGADYSLQSRAGLTAYTYTNNNGTISLQIPELNFFDVIKQSLDGRREAYSNIEIGNQPEELFEVPAGAPVVTTTRLGGIVYMTSAELRQGGTPRLVVPKQ